MEKIVEQVRDESMPVWVRGVLEAVTDRVASRGHDVRVWRMSGSSNDLLKLTFGGDRQLMVKRGRHTWVGPMFETARLASDLLHDRTSLTVPRPLALDRASGDPVQAYWRIPLPTLGDLWPDLDSAQRREGLRSLGGLLRRIHRVRVPGWGHLADPAPGPEGLEAYLEADLGGRLLPAVYGSWPAAVEPAETLLRMVPDVSRRAGSGPGALSHGDVHIHNVLCGRNAGSGSVSCEGVLDLDNARSLPPEADLASFDVLHGALFTQELPARVRRAVGEGYGRPTDPALLAFFRAVHLCNLGFHSALVGDAHHAAAVAGAFERAVGAVGGALRGLQRA